GELEAEGAADHPSSEIDGALRREVQSRGRCELEAVRADEERCRVGVRDVVLLLADDSRVRPEVRNHPDVADLSDHEWHLRVVKVAADRGRAGGGAGSAGSARFVA